LFPLKKITPLLFIFLQANALIAKQKEEVENQKLLVEHKQKEILDSIHYAERIRQAHLPNEKYVLKHMPGKRT
jgi:hypothetical protein